VGPEVIQEMEEQMKSIRQRIKKAQDQQKSYTNVHHVDHSYEVSDRVFLRVKLHKSSIKFGKGTKLSSRFVGPFEVVEKKGLIAYQLALPNSLGLMHDLFHVSILRHYISYMSHVIYMSSLQVSDKGAIMEELIRILDHRTRQL
jgi:hypothetical protein